MTDSLLTSDETVQELIHYTSQGGRDTHLIAGLVRDCLDQGGWSDFTTDIGKKRVTHRSFREFVEADPWDGLGTTKDALVGWVRPHDSEVADLIERAWRGEVPAARKAKGGPVPSSDNSGGTRVNTEDGHTADYLLSRLKRDDPALAERVVNGELTSNAAAMRLGWRKPRIVATSPTSVARKLREVWTDEQIEQLIYELEANR